MNDRLPLWTFVTEYSEGSTLVSQVRQASLDRAMRVFCESEDVKEAGLDLSEEVNKINEIENPPVRVTGTENVWCWTCVDQIDRLVLVNIVRTQSGVG